MSVEIDWTMLDAELTRSVTESLSTMFETAPRPSFIGPITVTAFSFGQQVPAVEIVAIRDIDKAFLEAVEKDEQQSVEASDEEGSEPAGAHLAIPLARTQTTSMFTPGLNSAGSNSYFGRRSPDRTTPAPASIVPPLSLQVHLKVDYSGQLNIGFSTSLLINYPSPKFMALPISMTVKAVALNGIFIIAYEGDRDRVHLTLTEPNSGAPQQPKQTSSFTKNNSHHNILSNATVHTQVGENDRHILKNVGKVEKFILELLQTTLENELVFPNFQTIMF